MAYFAIDPHVRGLDLRPQPEVVGIGHARSGALHPTKQQERVTVPNDPFELNRFVAAQQPFYEQALRELEAGSKQSHWMWFVFPQSAGLGASEMARRYAIASLAEARAFLEHPLLGPRLRRCTEAVLMLEHCSAASVFGFPDTLKFHSSMTLFAVAADRGERAEAVFARALHKYFDQQMDESTLDRLRESRSGTGGIVLDSGA